MSRRPWVVLFLIGLTAAVYAPVGHYGYVRYDDPPVIQTNPHVQPGLTPANVRWAVTGFSAGHWEPLTWWSLQADVSVWHGRPGPMHVENAALHAASAVLLYGLLTAATGAAGRSAVVAAVFAVHPIHVESVAWLTERRDALSTPPLLAAGWAFVRYARGGRWGWYAAFLGLYALSLAAKATGMTLPVVLLLVDWWPLRRSGWVRLALEQVPPLAMAVPTAIAAAAAQRAVGAAAALSSLSAGQRLANAAVTTVVYLAKLIWPLDLAVIYPHPGDRPAAAVVAATILLAMLTAFAWRQRRGRPYLLAGYAGFVVTLLPVVGLLQSGPQAMADRYAYVPSIGMTVAVVWLIADTLSRRLSVTCATVALVVLTVLGRRQVTYWRDTDALFAHALAVTGDNWVAYSILGYEAADRGDYPAAIGWYERSVRERPADPKTRAALARCQLQVGDDAAAERSADAAVRLAPTVSDYAALHDYALAHLARRGRHP